MLNTKLKPFKNIAFYNNSFYEINEKDLKNKWNIFFFFFFFYSFICPIELKDISKKKNYFLKKNINIFNISTDSHYVLKNWSLKELKIDNLIFISDFNHNISNNLNILNKKDGNCFRSTFIIDPNLIIRSIEIIDNGIGRSIDEIYKKTNMLISINNDNNLVCPYNWNNDNKLINIKNYL